MGHKGGVREMVHSLEKSFVFTLFIAVILSILLNNIQCKNADAAGLNEDDILRVKTRYPDDDELPYLPKCCGIKRLEQKRHEQSNSSSARSSAELAASVHSCIDRVGSNVWAYMHHYCAGLNRMKRYNRSKMMGFGSLKGPNMLQQQTLNAAINEFKYAEDHYANSPRYEVAMRLAAVAWWELRNYRQAYTTLYKGIQVRPKSASFYLQLSTYLVNQGQKAQAKKVLQKGLRATGGNKKIQRMLAGLK